jgi:hypothetical protein
VVQDRAKSLAVMKTTIIKRMTKENNLDRTNINKWPDACMCHAVRLPEINFAGFTCRLQSCNNFISKQDCCSGVF